MGRAELTYYPTLELYINPDKKILRSDKSVKNQRKGLHYFLKDHLGNTRMVLTDDYNVASPILEANSYYPFGLQQRDIALTQQTNQLHNKYTYNGKELQEDLGLDQYDYGARFQDPQLGVWHVQDAASEKASSWSPYRYGFDNPNRYADANGLYEVDGHYWTVYLMSMLVGQSNNMSYNIAYWTESPDQLMYRSRDMEKATNTWLNPMAQGSMHALTGGNSADEINISEGMIANAGGTQQLGLALHRFGDSYAHERVGDENKMYSAPLGVLKRVGLVQTPTK